MADDTGAGGAGTGTGASDNRGFVNFTPRNIIRMSRTTGTQRQPQMQPGLVQLLYANPFAGLDHEDPYAHLTKFYELCGTAGMSEADEESIFLRMFPLTLIGKAKEWLLDQPQHILSDWDQLEEKFCARYFSQSKFMDLKTAIATFVQAPRESLCEAWERYKSMLRKCPNHGFDARTQIHIFRNGLQQQHKLMLDAAAGGQIMSKTPEEAISIIDSMALTDQQGQYNRGPRRGGVLELGPNDAVLAQQKQLQQQVDELKKAMSELPKQIREARDAKRQQVFLCEICNGDHPSTCCNFRGEEVNYLDNQQRPPYQNNFQRGPNFQQPWRQEAGPSFQKAPQPPYQPPRPYQNQPPVFPSSKIEETFNQFMQQSMMNQKNNEATIRNLETQLGQLATDIAELKKKRFTANTELNPKDSCHGRRTDDEEES